MSEKEWADCFYRRDASWSVNPGRGIKFHAKWNGFTACRRLFVADFTALPAKDVPEILRCKREPCRTAFKQNLTP